MYLLRAHTYLGDDPAACVNCHIMASYYATWMHSSHSRDATCNDCHVPHENIVKKWAFKGMDGMKHVGAFLTKSEPQAIQAEVVRTAVLSPAALFSSKARRSPLLFGKAVAAEAPAQLSTSIRLMILVFIFILLMPSNIYFWKYF